MLVSDGSLTGTKDVTVTVQDLNEPPTVTGDAALSYPENTATTKVLDRYTATDPERRQVTWSLSGTDADDFRIDASSGNLLFDGTPDYEAAADSGGNNVYDIQVVATDDGNLNDGTVSQRGALSASFDVTITVTDVNEPPTVTGDADAAVDENTETFTRTYFASDPDGAASTFTWSLSGADRGDFNMDGNGNTGELTFRNTPDHESPADSNRDNEYLVTVWAADEGGLRGSLDVTVTVNDVNETPTITGDDDPSYQEEGTGQVARYQATDPERAAITWSVTGPDGSDFRISETGELTFVNPPDYESPAGANGNEYLVTVRARDDGFNTATLDVTVTVTPVNEPPTVTGHETPSLDENDENFSESYSASDPEGGASTFTWSLSGTDQGDFNISQVGALTFRKRPTTKAPPDSNRNNEYLVTVRASDGQYTGMLNVTVTVRDDNEAPEFTSSSKSRTSLTYPENSTYALYTYQATDPERGTIAWSVSGMDGGDFDISESGALFFADNPDFEAPVDANRDNEYLVTVQARDDGFNFARLEVTVNVTNSTGT